MQRSEHDPAKLARIAASATSSTRMGAPRGSDQGSRRILQSGRRRNQRSRSDRTPCGIEAMFPMTVGNMHTRVSPRWDLPTAIQFLIKELGDKGLFSIEVNNGHEGIKPIYELILANL